MKRKKQTHLYDLISKNDLNKLAGIHDQHCVSVYIPISGEGEKQGKNHGQIILKGSLKKLKHSLKAYNLTDNAIEDYLSPVENLMNDSQLWREQSGCLAIFLNRESLWYFKLPIDHAEFTYVSDHFYMLPVMPLFSDGGRFYILSLSLQDVKFFEGTRYSISEVEVEDLVPDKLEDVVGYDFRNKNLQFRSGQGGSAGVMVHGHGAGKDDKDIEVEKYFREIDKGLMRLLKNEDAPLILACVDHYHPVYASITNYSHLFQQNIPGNHEEKDPLLLHEMGWSLVKDYFLRQRKSMIKLLKDRSSSGKTSFDLNEIIPAAVDGRIEALFIQNDKDKYGLYDMVNRSLIIDENINANQASLYNMAAMQTWIKGGRVYLVDKKDMPFQHTSINAVFRY